MKWIIPICMGVLAILSILILRSIAPSLASTQTVFLILGATVFGFTQWYGLERWLRLAPLLYVGLIILLIIPLVTGTTTRGIAGWIDIGNLFSIQPSQLAIPVVLLLISPMLARFDGRNIRHFGLLLLLIGVPAGLIIIEPDLGTTIIYIVSIGAAVWLSKLDLRYILAILGMGAVVVVVAWSFFLKPYQKERIYSFANPQGVDSDSSYNARQALIAVGSGEVMGRGLGEGIQSHLRFLPERQTDFIFASLAEEVGFVGSALVLALYVGLIAGCYFLGARSDHPTGVFIAASTAMMLTVQTGVNIGMNMGVLPITGITLPLLSYGGSSIIAISWTLGLVQSLWMYQRPSERLHLS